MADIEFHEEENFAPRAVQTRKKTGFASALVRAGFAKDEKAANTLLLIIAVAALILAALLFLLMSLSAPVVRPPVDTSALPLP